MASATASVTTAVNEQPAQPHHVEHLEHKRKRQHKIALPETASTFVKPLLPYTMGHSIKQYFTLLEDAVDVTPFTQVKKTDMELDGLYLHKRPLGTVDSSNKGTVTHHVVLYLKEGDKLHSLDFGPDNGSDVTANFMAEHPCREVLHKDTTIPEADVLPLLYIGRTDLTLEDDSVIQAIRFAEGQMYHAMRNNCIHFADMMVRVLTRGKVRGAPLIYDMVCGQVPAQDPPESLMLALLNMSWFTICDGSPLTAKLLSSLDQPTLQHSVSISDLPSKRQEADHAPTKPTSPVKSSSPAQPTIPVLPNPPTGTALLSMLSVLSNAQAPNAIPVQNNAGPNLMTLLNLNGVEMNGTGVNGVRAVAAGVRVNQGVGQYTLAGSASTDSLQSSDTRDDA